MSIYLIRILFIFLSCYYTAYNVYIQNLLRKLFYFLLLEFKMHVQITHFYTGFFKLMMVCLPQVVGDPNSKIPHKKEPQK